MNNHERLKAMRGVRPLCVTAFVMFLIVVGVISLRMFDPGMLGLALIALSAFLGAVGILVTLGYLIGALRELQYPEQRREMPWGGLFFAAFLNLFFASIPFVALLLAIIGPEIIRNRSSS